MMNAEDKYKVVIVDDERTAIDALRRELGAYQELEIKGTANNGAKGKKMIMELRPDLLFLDVELPDVLGLNLLSEMRDEVLWDMKVVFYTSYDKYLLQALRESAFDFLLKPFETGDLRVVIERYRIRSGKCRHTGVGFSAEWADRRNWLIRFHGGTPPVR